MKLDFFNEDIVPRAEVPQDIERIVLDNFKCDQRYAESVLRRLRKHDGSYWFLHSGVVHEVTKDGVTSR